MAIAGGICFGIIVKAPAKEAPVKLWKEAGLGHEGLARPMFVCVSTWLMPNSIAPCRFKAPAKVFRTTFTIEGRSTRRVADGRYSVLKVASKKGYSPFSVTTCRRISGLITRNITCLGISSGINEDTRTPTKILANQETVGAKKYQKVAYTCRRAVCVVACNGLGQRFIKASPVLGHEGEGQALAASPETRQGTTCAANTSYRWIVARPPEARSVQLGNVVMRIEACPTLYEDANSPVAARESRHGCTPSS